jgi:NTP pyrophosphatase (non-canonical NTP hydrolase)
MSDNTPLLKSVPRFESDSQSDSETYGEAESLQALLAGFEFYKLKRTGMPSLRRVFVSKNFHLLVLEKNDAHSQVTKTIQITEITAVEAGFESRLTPALLKRFYNCRQYGLRIYIRDKVLEVSTENQQIRDFWVQALNKLKELTQQWGAHNGIKAYWKSQCSVESLQKELLDVKLQISRLSLELKESNEERELMRLQLIGEVMERMLDKVCSKPIRVKELGNKPAELQQVYNVLHTTEGEESVRPTANPEAGVRRGWVLVLQMLDFRELHLVKQLNIKFLDLVPRFLSNRSHWTNLTKGDLHPRNVSWPYYIRIFHGHNSVVRQQPMLAEDILTEINQDIGRTYSNRKEEVEDVLRRVCGIFEDVGYCQGMNLVVEFLFSILFSSNKVFGAFMVMMRAPYFYSELWQPGFPRLKLLMFQLNALITIKVPTLSRHFNLLDIQLDMLAPSWLLTLFCTVESLPRPIVLRIWDMFWVDGWRAVLSATLTLLHLSQSKA